MKKILAIFIAAILLFSSASNVQIKLEDMPFNLDEIFGKAKILTVKKGFNPVFKLGDFQVNKVGILGEKLKGVEILGKIFDKKHVDKVTKLYKTYKTGLVVYKV